MNLQASGEGVEPILHSIDRKLSALLWAEAAIAGMLALWGAASVVGAAVWLRRRGGS